jgi:hypothetical protein
MERPQQDKTLAEFAALEWVVCAPCTFPCNKAIQPTLELKTQPKQLLGSLPLDIAYPAKLTTGSREPQIEPLSCLGQVINYKLVCFVMMAIS